ncbi:MAG: 50S ribosomal protein L11 methyltransferase [Microthrixaceae bacterium]
MTEPSETEPQERLVIELKVSSDRSEIVSDWLWQQGSSAVVEQADTTLDGSVAISGDISIEAAEAIVAGVLRDQALSGVSHARIVGTPGQDHAAGLTWRSFAEPVECGRVMIVPNWLDQAAPDQAALDQAVSDLAAPDLVAPGQTVQLLMEPGDAFGAGTHVTTRLCLEAVSDLISAGNSVLDFGCGTGVLGVASALLGATRVAALDIDPEAVRVTEDVARLNGVASIVSTSDDSLDSLDGQFDVVFANVLIGVIEEFAEALLRRLSRSGIIVISGILDPSVDGGEQRERALSAFDASAERNAEVDADVDRATEPSRLFVHDELVRDDWLRLILGR